MPFSVILKTLAPRGWHWGSDRCNPLLRGTPPSRRRCWYQQRSPLLRPPLAGRRLRRCGLWTAARSSPAVSVAPCLLRTQAPRFSSYPAALTRNTRLTNFRELRQDEVPRINLLGNSVTRAILKSPSRLTSTLHLLRPDRLED